MPYLGILGDMILKNYCQTAKFSGKIKMPEFGTKMLYLGVFGLEMENNVVIFEISTFKFV